VRNVWGEHQRDTACPACLNSEAPQWPTALHVFYDILSKRPRSITPSMLCSGKDFTVCTCTKRVRLQLNFE
jgi:hypothetical protein